MCALNCWLFIKKPLPLKTIVCNEFVSLANKMFNTFLVCLSWNSSIFHKHLILEVLPVNIYNLSQSKLTELVERQKFSQSSYKILLNSNYN